MPDPDMPLDRSTGFAEDDAAADKRDAILAVATSTIVHGGVASLRVERVARQAGVSAALIYYHFSSRSGLVKAALEQAVESAPSAALGGPAHPENGFDAVFKALLAELSDEKVVRDHAIVWGEVSATAVFDKEFRGDVRRASEGWVGHVADGIRAGIDDGSIRPDVDPGMSAELVVAIVDGLCARWLSGAMDLDRAREVLAAALHQLLAE